MYTMTKTELWNRTQLAWESPNCIWELERKNGFVWKEDGMLYAVPGVAVMCAGLETFSEYRDIRAIQLDVEWSYLMFMEQAICFLFDGNLHGFNHCVTSAHEPKLVFKKPYFFRFKGIETIKQVLTM